MLYDCIVIGAGAAGLFFAATRQGRGPVLVIDRQERPGRKILFSGGGKCNVTNLSVSPENYLGANPRFTRQALAAFRPEDMLAFLKEHRIALEEREHGQIFCRQGAEKLRDLLVSLAQKNGAEFLLGTEIKSVRALPAPNGQDAKRLGPKAPTGLPTAPASSPLPQDALSVPDEAANKTAVKASSQPDEPGLANLKPSRESRNGCSEHLAEGVPEPGVTHGARQPSGEARFVLETSQGRFFSRSLLIACGGPAWPNLGATFAGKKFASLFGHSYIPPRPALTPLHMPVDWPLHRLQGISLNVTASAPHGPAFTLPLLFTHRGISGPACLQASSYLLDGEAITLDFLPGQNFSQLIDEPGNGKSTPLLILRKLLPERLAAELLFTQELAPFKERKCAELPRAARAALGKAVHQHQAVPLQVDFKLAESSSGGIDTAEINPKSMESRLVPGLYFAGEVMDVCGQLGGYNLHWAWASAAAVGRTA